MQPGKEDYKHILTEVIKTQMAILGPQIALSRARNVGGLVVEDDGVVSEYSGDPQELIHRLIDQYVELSGLIVRKTMESLLSVYPQGVSSLNASVTEQQIKN